MENKIKVSVIMPVYNSGEYLKKAVESILNQSDERLELILVDDGSTDGSANVCDDYALKDSRVVVLHQKNGGICKARNAALKVAKGEYIGFSDHDDQFEDGMFKKCLNEIEKHNPDLLKFGKRVDFIDAKNQVYRQDVFTFKESLIYKDKIVNQYLLLRQMSVFRFVWDGWFKASIIKEHNIEFDPYYKYGGEDHEFCNVFSRYIDSIKLIPEIFYIHFLRQSFSTSFKKVDFLYNIEEGKRIKETLDRTKLYNAQTPQAFKTSVIIGAYKKLQETDIKVTDDAQVVEFFSDVEVYVVEGDYSNIKVTTESDLK